MVDELTQQEELWDVETETIDAGSTTQEIELPTDRGRLVLLSGPQVGRVYDIQRETLIGRHPEAAIRLPAADVSRRHARLYLNDDDNWVLADLGSRNATLINGTPLRGTVEVLQYGDRIQLGAQTIFVFSRHDKLEDQVLQSQRMEAVGRLAGGIAHDFNNLMTAIIGSVDYLQLRRARGQRVDDLDMESCLDDVTTAARRAADLTRGLLAFSGDRQGTVPRAVDVTTIAREVVALCQRTFPDNVQIRLRADEEAQVVSREAQLHQIVMNLCLNARDAIPAGGKILVDVRRIRVDPARALSLPFLAAGDYVQIAVHDTGLGMDAETLRRAFEPFFSTKARGQGTGLGLATVYGLVRGHGGHVQLESDPGVSTSARVYLPATGERPLPEPLQQNQDTARAGTKDLTPAVPAGRPLVLVVDDEANVLRATRRLLEQLGFRALLADSGLEGIKIFADQIDQISAVLLDIMMPRIGGDAVFGAILALAPHIPVLLMSGYDHEGSGQLMLQAGAAGFLPKPFDSESLKEAIAAAMELSAKRLGTGERRRGGNGALVSPIV